MASINGITLKDKYVKEMSERVSFEAILNLDGKIITPAFSILNEWYNREVERFADGKIEWYGSIKEVCNVYDLDNTLSRADLIFLIKNTPDMFNFNSDTVLEYAKDDEESGLIIEE